MNTRATRIEELLLRYISHPSISGTTSEKEVESFLSSYALDIPYFREHPEHRGLYSIEGDPHARTVFWALRKGEGDKTVILLHHSDVVETIDYGSLESLAYSPSELEAALRKNALDYEPAVQRDLAGEDYLYGHGTADMKGGGAIQLTLLEEYCSEEDFSGNVLLLAVPDEENLSAGMRGALPLLEELKEQYSLEYTLLINCEPYQRTKGRRTLSIGSVGKLLFFVYVRGKMAHVGRESEGFSPMGLLGKILSESDQFPLFSETEGEEVSPAPVWVYARDNKHLYDASMVTGAFACMSLLHFRRSPGELSAAFEDFLKESFASQLGRLQEVYGEERDLSWEQAIRSFSDFARSREEEGYDWQAERSELISKVEKGERTYVEATFALLERMMHARKTDRPLVVYGLIPPYYPGVCSESEPVIQGLLQELKDQGGEDFAVEKYFSGISDLSYTRVEDAQGVEETMQELMPFYGESYSVAFDILSRLQLPGINIGPLGKDLHKKTERVLKSDLFDTTPRLVDIAVRYARK